jgi:DNA-binding PadR family transcriptional regulator
MGEGAFGHRGGPGRFGGGWRARRGEARYILLDVLNDGPKHGYEIIKTLEERTGGEWAPSPGTVYPTLQFLEDLGLIQAVQDGERKAFNLTDKGREELASRQEELQAFWARFAPNQEVSSSEVGYIRDEVETLIKTLRRGLHHSGKTLDQETLKKIRGVIEGAREEVRKLLSD